MVAELSAYGLVAGISTRIVRSGTLLADIYISLAVAMVVGRIVAGVLRALIFSSGGYSIAAWMASYFVTALPGLILQIILIPSIMAALESAGLIPRRYPRSR
jgi:hypothetical protein